MLGDSFTQGVGVAPEKTFSKQLQGLLNANALEGKHYEVINAGIMSYSPSLEYFLLKEIIEIVQPDLVVVNFDMSDIQDEYLYKKYRTTKGIPHHGYRSWYGGLFRLEQYLLRKSVFFSMLHYFIDTKALYYPRKWVKKIIRGYKKHIIHTYRKKDWITIGDIATDRFAIIRENPGEYLNEYWQEAFNALLAMRELAIQHNSRFLIATYPYAAQVNDTEWVEGRRSWHFEDRLYASTYPFDMIRNFASKNGIPFIDTVYAFRSADQGPLYYLYDGHFTEEGHALYAEALYEYIKKLL